MLLRLRSIEDEGGLREDVRAAEILLAPVGRYLLQAAYDHA